MNTTIKREDMDRGKVDFSDVISGASAAAGASRRDPA